LVDEKVKLRRPRFTRVSGSETENFEVLIGRLFKTQTVAARVRPLRSRTGHSPWPPWAVPIPKPEPFIQSTGHTLEADWNTLCV